MAKKRAVDGVMLLAQAVKGHPLAPGRVGLVKLSVHKRPSGSCVSTLVRATCLPSLCWTPRLLPGRLLALVAPAPVSHSGGRWHPVHVVHGEGFCVDVRAGRRCV